jgi:hypothetical protein
VNSTKERRRSIVGRRGVALPDAKAIPSMLAVDKIEG